MAVCAVATAVAVTEKLALDAPAGIVTAAGAVTALLLLARLTVVPLLAAAELSVTVHASLAAPVIEALAQERPLNVAAGVPETNVE